MIESHQKRITSSCKIAQRMNPILRRYGVITVLLLLFTVFSILRPGIFPSVGNLITIFKQIALLGIISTGLTVCLILGDFDLSIAAVATWSGVLVASLLPLVNMWVAIVAVLSMAVGVGLVNGFFSAVVGISPFIVTLAMQTMLRGLTLWYTGGYSLYSGIPRAFVNLARGTFLRVPYLVYYMLFIFLVFYVVINHSSFGKKVYAVGGNPIASRYSGISAVRTRLLGFAISSVLASLAGILLAARLSSGQPRAGEGLLLNAFAAVFLGAATFHGGRFHVAGTLVGVLFIGVLNNGLIILGIPFYLQYVIQGAVLVLAIAVSRVARRT
ncbi:ABC transporter permease [Candidatus Bipolaricaulota bacterium]|nr:ABC transporter permease [Candidatus Bipolaricaulota bacterium]